MPSNVADLGASTHLVRQLDLFMPVGAIIIKILNKGLKMKKKHPKACVPFIC
jgi:hypothetical protein